MYILHHMVLYCFAHGKCSRFFIKLEHQTKCSQVAKEMNFQLEKYVYYRSKNNIVAAQCALELLVNECIIRNVNINDIEQAFNYHLPRFYQNPSLLVYCMKNTTINHIETARAKHFVDTFPITFDASKQSFALRPHERQCKRNHSSSDMSKEIKACGMRSKPNAVKKMSSCKFLPKN